VSKGVQIAIGALFCATLLGWYGYSNLADTASYQYYQTLEEFLAELPAATPGRALRVKGYVSNGSIDRQLETKQVRFAIQNDPPHASGDAPAEKQLAVLYPSLEIPDLFQDGAEVVVEGRVKGSGAAAVFVADNVLAKCPSKFEAQAQGMAEGGLGNVAGESTRAAL
jgi:cytochrome c-type biogenesis protein CcmE